ncbi:MAG: hypothetical protein AM325_013770 [Candidatus Thorarchaeota archaeon SMTZ1-45]
MEGVSGDDVRRRRREYSQETEETRVEELTAAELVRAREESLDASESDEQAEVSARELVEQVVKELREEEKNAGKISRRLEDALEEVEEMERANESTEEKLRRALEEIDNQEKEVINEASEEESETQEFRYEERVMEGNLESEFSRKRETRESVEVRENTEAEEIDSVEERIERVLQNAERRDLEKWIEETVREIVEEEQKSKETGEIVERWTRVVAKELFEEERPEVPEPKEAEEVSEKPWEIHSETDLDRALENHADLMARKDFDKRYQDAAEYCKLEDKENTEPPELVRELEFRELKRMYEVVHGGPPEVKIESMEDMDELIEKHPNESKRSDFDERKEFSELYFQIRNDHSMKRDEIAEAYRVSKGFVSNSWNDIEPAQIRQLRGYEEDRRVKEWYENNPTIDESILRRFRDFELFDKTGKQETVQQIENQVVRDAFEPLRETKEPTKEDLVSAVARMVRVTPDETHRFYFADLNAEFETKNIKQFERCLRTNREEIEESLSKTIGLEHVRARVAVVENRIYTWIPKHRPDELVEAYEDQFYYFNDRKEIVRIIEELRGNLGIEGNLRKELPQISEVVRQLIEYEGGDSARKKPLDIHSTRIEGKIIRMYLDATGRMLSDLEGSVVKVAGISGRAGIENPRFPEGEKLEVLKARLVATVASDCHLWNTGRISYNEAHLGRISRVQDIVSEFGDIVLEPKFRKGKYDIHIHCQIGLILINEGLTPGNKTINNPGLPAGFMDWSDTAKWAYLEELIPEDGCFTGGKFKWFRSHAIYVDKQREKYEFESEIGLAEVEVVKEEGKKLKGLVPKSILTIRHLEDLQYDDNSDISKATKSLLKVVNESTNHLINDETRLAESLGFEITVNPQHVSYYPRTGRVSVSWVAATSSKDDTIRWAMECPPNDIRKKQVVERWLRKTAENWMDKRPLRDW